MKNIFNTIVILLTFQFSLLSCTNNKLPNDTLGSIDTLQSKTTTNTEVFVKPKSEDEIKDAYYNYIKNAPTNDKTRRLAIGRLTELELNRINVDAKNNQGETTDLNSSPLYMESLKKSLQLLEQSLKEYPDAKDNDNTLYQIARLKDQLGLHDESIAALRELCRKYPRSKRYAEAQFRLAESAFIEGDFIAAEAAYTEVSFSAGNDEFYERALFKRGWARYKQALFAEAADDFLAALDKHQFDKYENLSASDKSQYDEYFRALGLNLMNLQNAQELQQYFSSKIDFKYLFESYEVISSLYLEQERYFDAAAIMEQFIANNPSSTRLPRAQLTILEAWKRGKFRNQFVATMEKIFSNLPPNSSYWVKLNNSHEQQHFFTELRDYLLTAATYFQEDYQKSRKKNDVEMAKTWYERYLGLYASYARQDKVYSLLAELLAMDAQPQEALHYFELAAYDGDIILDKEAAYSTIVETSKLYEQNKSNSKYLDKLIHYTLLSAQLYPNESRYQTAALHAADLALNSNKANLAIALTNTLTNTTNDKNLYQANIIKGLALLEEKSFVKAEAIFGDLLKQGRVQTEPKKLHEFHALAIYKQGEEEASKNHISQAIQQFSRVAAQEPSSDIAPKSLYEGISLAMKHEQWPIAIELVEQFQQLFPKHELAKDATRQLSIAYLSAGDGVKAAQTFEKIAAQEGSQDLKMATLWKAAELYDTKQDFDAAIRTYRTYVESYPRPYPQFIEGMYKISQLYAHKNDQSNLVAWQNKIIIADKEAINAIKTDRTNFITATILIDAAKRVRQQFESVKLVEPLAENLRNKKKLMQETIAAYGQASTYSLPDVVTEATFSIGSVYQSFAAALTTSERPKNLKGEELEQYNILIEDQAFPFEEKAIEFYEINMSHTKDGISNSWISHSFTNLEKLYPVRYSRKGKMEVYHGD